TTFGTQARALFIKNAAQQRRQRRTNIILILYPVIFCILLYVLQRVINNALSSRDNQCGCYCLSCCRTDAAGTTTCRTNSAADPCQQSDDCQAYDDSRCGVEYSVNGQAGYCAVPYPPTWPALMQVPLTRRRAEPWRPAAAMLYTGQDAAAAAQLAGGLFGDGAPSAAERAAAQATLAAGEAAGTIYASGLSQLGLTLGTWRPVTDFMTYYLEPGFLQGENAEDYNASMYMMVADAAAPAAVVTADLLGTAIAGAANSLGGGGLVAPTFTPTTGEPVWEANDSTINSMLYCGYARAWCNDTFAFNEISQAWDFQDTSTTSGTFNTRMWYNATGRYGVYQTPPTLVRVNQGINLATNAFLQAALGPDYQAQLLGLMEMPKGATILSLNFSALLGPLFFVWLAQLLLPTMLASLVYEKEMRLRTMMKMHGLGDGAYWIIQYVWFFILNFLYSMVLIGIGTAVDLAIFRLTSYSYLVVFYFLWVNCLISFAFLLSTFFRSSRTAVVVAFLYTFATGLIGYLLLTQFIQSGHWWVIFLELVPGWALFRGLWEMGTYAFRGAYKNSGGMSWSSLSDPGNGSTAVLIIFAVEWVVFLILAWYFEQVIPSGVGITKHPLFFLGGKFRKRSLAAQSTPTDVVQVPLEPEDVRAERQRVSDGDTAGSSIVIKDLVKIFPPTGGNPRLAAVKGLTLAVERGECFGLLGPNGAGKSTTINILTGFLTANGGSVVVEGNDLRDGMKPIHALMGVCPQDNLLWEQLTARQHLDFYGRLKGLKGTELKEAVDAALKSVNLYNSGVGDKQVQAYSGGMKRRLSVAISFMGSPAVVYLDEPSTGLDPASRQNLWDVVKEGKKGRGIVLTTHSMEEATVLCDRLGIFVDGQLVCLGSPQELTSRYADFYVYTIMTPPEQGEAAHKLVLSMSPNARQTYALAGTRKYELPVADVTLAVVFNEMTAASNHLTILDWGIANATLEEVFIKTTFRTQATALFLKNVAQQRRQRRSNALLIISPVLFFVILFVLETLINNALDTPTYKCGCYCLRCCSTNGSRQYTCRNNTEGAACRFYEDCEEYDESRCGLGYSTAAQAMYCPVPQPSTWPALMQIPRTARRAEPWRPAAAMLYTAIYASGLSQLGLILGSDRNRFFPTYYVEPSLISTRYYNASLTAVVRNASSPSVSLFLDQLGTSLDALSNAVGLGLAVPSISPVTGEPAWQANASAINRFLYCGYPQIRCGGRVQEDYEVSQAWDFQNTSVETGQYNVRMWFNGTGRVDVYNSFPSLLRVNQGINLAANSFLQRALGPGYQSRLLGFQEMPKDVTRLTVSISTLLGPLFFVWLSQLLLPTMLLTLVYEKEKRLIQYTWFFIMNFLFSMILVGMGWAVDLPIFRLTSYSYTVVFYFLWCNCLIGFAFLLSTLFTSSRTAVVTAFLLIFGTGLIGFLLLSRFIDNGHWWVIFLELIPGFALYRGFYEMGAYAFRATFSPGSTRGLQWSTLSDPGNGSIAVLIIFAVEWVIVEPEDVQAERARVENGGADEACIQIKSLVKIFPAVGGNKRLAAVKGLTMAVERGECFGLLGPNGAGKSTTVNILTGFLTATHGSVIVEGHDTRNGMRPIHSIMGGEDLETAIIKSLASVNLLHGRVGEKQVLSYSGGMKRRLSVAISFIGSPVVVYLDEPSTGLDPASRHNLWDVVKEGKEGRGIVLTTHSMEEANILCDRLGIFVDGQLVCLGTPKDLTTRFGGYYVFTIMTPAEEGESAHRLVLSMSPNARQTYSLAGTRKYELPVSDVTLAGVFEAMTTAAAHLTILDWGIANATLEEVFIKLAKHLGVEGGN
ncbi:hypothetical protein APUTEX25_005454, partial [Auxenochlorella protothecoides]